MQLIAYENQRHSTAFAYYLQLGGQRSYGRVAARFGVSDTSVRKWARSFNWEQRVLEADIKANAAQRANVERSYVATTEDFRTLKDRVLANLKERMDSDQCSVMELIHILRAVKTELGEPWNIIATPQPKEVRNPFEGIFESFFGGKEAPAPTGTGLRA